MAKHITAIKSRANTSTCTNKPICDKCADMGIVNVGDNTYKTCDCELHRQKQDKIKTLFESAAIPKRYQAKTLDNFDQSWQPKAFEAAKDYIDNWRQYSDEGRSLFLVGDVGTGKSHLAYAILNALIKKSVPGMVASVPDMLDDLRDNKDGQIEALKEIDLLVLDDLGSQKNTEWVTERLFVILNARYADLKPTIITSNHRLEVLKQTDGWQRITDRIIEMSRLIRVEGKSYRQRGGRLET